MTDKFLDWMIDEIKMAVSKMDIPYPDNYPKDEKELLDNLDYGFAVGIIKCFYNYPNNSYRTIYEVVPHEFCKDQDNLNER